MHPRLTPGVLALLAILLLAPRAGAQVTFTWFGGTGDWTIASNWRVGGQVATTSPSTQDSVVINAGTVTLNVNREVRRLQLSGGTLTGDGDLLVRASDNLWSAGVMTGNGRVIIAPQATLAIAPSAAVRLERGIEVEGVFNINMTSAQSTLRISSGGLIRVLAGATMSLDGAIGFATTAGTIIVEPGGVLRAGGTRFTDVMATLRVGGLLELRAGQPVRLGQQSSVFIEGTFRVGPGADVELRNAAFGPEARLEGSDPLDIYGGSFSQPVISYGGPLTLYSPGFNGADVTVDCDVAIDFSISAASTVRFTRAVSFLQSPRFLGGTIIFEPGPGVAISNMSTPPPLIGSMLVFRRDASMSGTWTVDPTAGVVVGPGVTLTMSGCRLVNPQFARGGTFESSGTTVLIGPSSIQLSILRSGAMRCVNGCSLGSNSPGTTVLVDGPVVSENGTPIFFTGDLTVGPAGSIESASTLNLNGRFTFNGRPIRRNGLLRLDGQATVAVDTELAAPTELIATLSGPGPLRLAAGQHVLQGGTDQLGLLVLQPGAALRVGAESTLGAVDNSGHVTLDRGFNTTFPTHFRADFFNRPGATLTRLHIVDGPGRIVNEGVFDQPLAAGPINLRVENFGVLRLSGGVSTFTQPPVLRPEGVVEAVLAANQYGAMQVGGGIDLAGTLRVAIAGGFTPWWGFSYAPVTAASVRGRFDRFEPPLGPVLAPRGQLSYTSVSVVYETIRPCPADSNDDRELTFDDIQLFVARLNAQHPRADFNADGEWTFDDVALFVGAFNAGC